MRRPTLSRGIAPMALLAIVALAIVAWRAADRAFAPGDATRGTIGAARDDGGLRLALALPPGPYFRDELLPVTVTLTNNTGRPVPYAGTLMPGPCRLGTLDAALARDGQYVAPVSVGFIRHGCLPRPIGAYPTLRPGASLRARVLLGLPTPGRLTVTGRASFPAGTLVTVGGPLPTGGPLDRLRPALPALFHSTHAPFTGGWPSLTIDVSARLPTGRVLHIVRRGHTVLVRGYPRALPAPVAQDAEAYVVAEGVCVTGLGSWTPVGALTLGDHGCEGEGYSSERWQVLVGAPGYAIARAVYCYNPPPTPTSGVVRGFFGPPQPACIEVIRG